MRLEIPRELKSPNKWQGRHWRYKHRETQMWERDIEAAWLRIGYRDRPKEQLDDRRRVAVTRLVPSKRNFIKDDDNLKFSLKPVLDALKRLSLICDDSREWLVCGLPEQRVSPDGEWRTVIEIEPVEAIQAAQEGI